MRGEKFGFAIIFCHLAVGTVTATSETDQFPKSLKCHDVMMMNN